MDEFVDPELVAMKAELLKYAKIAKDNADLLEVRDAQLGGVSKALAEANATLRGLHAEAHTPGMPVAKYASFLCKPATFACTSPDYSVEQWLACISNYAKLSDIPVCEQVHFAATYLRGDAAKWYWHLSASDRGSMNMTRFVESLTITFGRSDQDREILARERLATAKQGHRTVHLYVREFVGYLQDVPDISEGDKIAYFRRGLDSSLKQFAIYKPESAEKWDHFKDVMEYIVRKAQVLSVMRGTDNRNEHHGQVPRSPPQVRPTGSAVNRNQRTLWRAKLTSVSGPSSAMSRRSVKPWQEDRRRQFATRQSTHDPQTEIATITKDEAERRMKLNLCKLCSQPGAPCSRMQERCHWTVRQTSQGMTVLWCR